MAYKIGNRRNLLSLVPVFVIQDIVVDDYSVLISHETEITLVG